MGYVRGLVHGTVAGAVVGVLVAPRAGTETRRRLRDQVERWSGRRQRVATGLHDTWTRTQPTVRTAFQTAEGVAGVVQPLVESATQRFIDLVGRSPRRPEGDDIVVPAAPAGTGATPPSGNGREGPGPVGAAG